MRPINAFSAEVAIACNGLLRMDVLRANYGSNPWQEKNQVITSVSWVSRVDDANESLLRSQWDLIVVDEAHKMSAYSTDKKTLGYQVGEALSERTDHYPLMTSIIVGFVGFAPTALAKQPVIQCMRSLGLIPTKLF